MNGIAFACMIASGTLLPLMDLLFGKFVTVFNRFAIGLLSPEEYRKQVDYYTSVVVPDIRSLPRYADV
jgi:ATP-binding cassette subfamily B (MDR/TAP) protein 1